ETIGLAYKLVGETLRRKNTVDKLLFTIIPSNLFQSLKIGVQSFIRLFVYTTKFSTLRNINAAIDLLQIGREILGWHDFHSAESFFGRIITFDINNIYDGLSDDEKIALETFHPIWFVRYCFELFGRQEALEMLNKNGEGPSFFIRVNTLKGDEAIIVKQLESEGIKLEKDPDLACLYRVLSTLIPLIRTETYRKGLFSVQDKASCLAVELSGVEKDAVVLDFCAAPGLKTTHMAQLMSDKGKIFAIDISLFGIRALKKEIKRAGVTVVDILFADASHPIPLAFEADIVVVDPPSTNTGIFRNDPSKKWRVKLEDIQKYAKIQELILNEAAKHAKVEGVLLYMSSSITLEENELLIKRFLSLNHDYKLEEMSHIGSSGLLGMNECRRLYPHVHDSNGSFIAKLRRINPE
ncbi:MAG: RsmB/NOP family class I SAM-dependent RNA methyltransferase, partial [Candidatus Bathyarchaeota archaeon]